MLNTTAAAAAEYSAAANKATDDFEIAHPNAMDTWMFAAGFDAGTRRCYELMQTALQANNRGKAIDDLLLALLSAIDPGSL